MLFSAYVHTYNSECNRCSGPIHAVNWVCASINPDKNVLSIYVDVFASWPNSVRVDSLECG